jgi:hypothetical protein
MKIWACLSSPIAASRNIVTVTKHEHDESNTKTNVSF